VPSRPTQGQAPAEPAPRTPRRPPAPAVGDVQSVIVQPGDSFWSLAEELVSLRVGRAVTDPEVIGPWLDLIAANRDALPDPGDPDLLLPGTVLRLPVRAGW
jgi:nucleoid-associated protein YgaU